MTITPSVNSHKGKGGEAIATATVLTDDLEISYLVSGPVHGVPVVAVHGWPDDPHCWDAVLPALHAGGCRVYRPYLRGFGDTRFRNPAKPRSGQIGALGRDLADFLDALDLDGAFLVGHDWGARAAYVVAALFPERVRAVVAISAGYSTNRPDAAVSWPLAHAYWYEWLVATQRGRAAIDEDRRAFSRYLWRTWSPGWEFDEGSFDQAAEAWDNSDWPAITVHAYTHRWGEADGDPAYSGIEQKLAEPAPIAVPTLLIHGAADADNLVETTADLDGFFTGPYRRVVLPGIGHFVPREAPDLVAELLMETVGTYSGESSA